jgi:hypothetical protein
MIAYDQVPGVFDVDVWFYDDAFSNGSAKHSQQYALWSIEGKWRPEEREIKDIPDDPDENVFPGRIPVIVEFRKISGASIH